MSCGCSCARTNPFALALSSGLDTTSAHRAPTNTKGNVKRTEYACRQNGSDVVLYTIEAQRHARPGGVAGLRNGNVDAPSREISATDTMLDFFWRHPKRITTRDMRAEYVQ